MPGPRFEFTRSGDDKRPELSLAGELDAHAAVALEAALDELPAEAARIVLDMSQVDFIDSAGLGVIVAANRQRGNGVVILRQPNERVEKVLEYAGLVGHLTIE